MNHRITISFLPKRDEDLILFLETNKDGNLSEYIRQLIRNEMEGQSTKKNDNEGLIELIMQKIGSLEDKGPKSGDLFKDSLTEGKVEDAINDLF